MSTFNIFKCYEPTYDGGFDEIIESFDNFIREVESVYGAHNMNFEFHEYKEYRNDWLEDDRIDYPSFPRDGYFRIAGKFDLILGVYANMSEEWSRKEIGIFRDYVERFGGGINQCAIFLSDENITPEVVALKSELAKELGDNYVDARSYGELKFNFLLQLRGICYYDDTRIMVKGSSVWFGCIYVCDVSAIPYLENNKDRAQQIVDALSFAMALRYNKDTSEFGCQMVKLLKNNKNKSVAKLLDYKSLKDQIAKEEKLHIQSVYATLGDKMPFLLDKLKLFALNALIIEGDSAESRRLNRRYYKERYETSVNCKLYIWDTAPVVLDYIALLKDEKRAVTLMEECVAQQLRLKENYQTMRYFEVPKIVHYLNFLQDKIIAYYEKVKDFDKVVEICLSEIERERRDGHSIKNIRPKTLYSKLGAIYEAKLTERECVL